jgi:hypothetical protein
MRARPRQVARVAVVRRYDPMTPARYLREVTRSPCFTSLASTARPEFCSRPQPFPSALKSLREISKSNRWRCRGWGPGQERLLSLTHRRFGFRISRTLRLPRMVVPSPLLDAESGRRSNRRPLRGTQIRQLGVRSGSAAPLRSVDELTSERPLMLVGSRVDERPLLRSSSLRADVELRLLYLGTGRWRRDLRGS